MTNLLGAYVLSALALVILGVVPARAHPHVWVTMKSEIVYGSDGSLVGVRHAWTFDEMFSTFATQGIQNNKKGEFTREELKPLAEVNVTSLKEFGYFTFVKVGDKKVSLADPVDYYLDFKDSRLTLNFTLPVQSPFKSDSVLDIDIYDPSYFVDFTFAPPHPVALNGARADCKISFGRPGGGSAPMTVPEEMFFRREPAINYGAQFSNRISVKCE